MMRKRGFTLVEIAIVVIVIAIMISMIPFRMKSLQMHTKFSLITNQREDFWQKNVTRMRQGNKFPLAVIELSTTGAQILFTGSTTLPSETISLVFPEDVASTLSGWTGRSLGSYGLACNGYDSGFVISMGTYRKCYRVDLPSCNLLTFSCNPQ